MRMLVFLICLLKPLVHGDVFESEQPVPNRIPISLTAQARATGTHGLSSGITPSQTPTLGGVAERYGASTSASRLGGHGAPHQGTSQLGSISEHQASHAPGVSGGGDAFTKGKGKASSSMSQRQADFRPEHPLSEYQLKTTDTPQNRATFERYLAERRANLTREEVLTVQDKDLWNRMDDLYREKAQVLPKSTAGAYRHEKLTGELVGGRSHDLKTKQNISFLEAYLKNTPSASSHDRSIAEQVLKDLQNAEFFQ